MMHAVSNSSAALAANCTCLRSQPGKQVVTATSLKSKCLNSQTQVLMGTEAIAP
jgi:hypothetical protein